MPGYLLLTFERTAAFSAELPNWLTRARALRAWFLSSMGYRLPGKAKDLLGMAFLAAVVSLATFGLSDGFSNHLGDAAFGLYLDDFIASKR
jgi:hypothetical protein